MKTRSILFFIVLLGSLVMFAGCVPDDTFDDQQPPSEEGVFEPGTGEIGEDGHPLGWADATHGKNADPNYELLFGNSDREVLRMDLVIAPSDWQAMMEDMEAKLGSFGGAGGCGTTVIPTIDPEVPWDMTGGENPIYVPCNLVFKGITWYHVGLRFKGNSSLRTAWQSGSYKMSMRFNMDKFEDDFPEIKNQRFYGFDKLALCSSNFDESLIREKVAGDIYRDMGVPVARASFCRVFVDYGQGKKYFGLYVLQEIPAKPMLESRFIDDSGNLYKPDGLSASFNTWNEATFDKETNEEEGDFSDVLALYYVLHIDRSDEAAFRASLESLFDVDGWLLYLAVNQVISNWDTYGRVAHNYYLYHDPGDGILHWIPWDFTAALHAGLDSSMPPLSLELTATEVGDNWPLIRYLIDIPDYHARYVANVKRTIQERFYPARMQAIYASARALIEPFVTGTYAEVAGYTNLNNKSQFSNAFNTLNTHVENRYSAATQFVNRHQP